MRDGEAPVTKSDRTRAAILAAARAIFAERGFDAATVRDIAARAQIDPAMVIRYFGSKEQLFARATDFDLALPRLDGVPKRGIGAALVRHFLDRWEGEAGGGGLTILLRTSASNDDAAARMRQIFADQVQAAIARLGDPTDAGRRAGLVSSQILGLAFARYVLKLPSVVALTRDEIVAQVAPTIQRYVAG
jgi:AcrR family transcriptional regulator